MAAKAKSRRLRERRRHLESWGIILIVLIVFGVSTVGGIRLKQKNLSYQERENNIQAQIDKEEERSKEIERLIRRRKSTWKMWRRTSWDLSTRMKLFLKQVINRTVNEEWPV